MRILTIRQPWAHLIVQGTKNIENRDWKTSYRGPVLIHASLKLDRDDCDKYHIDTRKLKIGGIVGIAEIVDCVSSHKSKWFQGRYGFVLRHRKALPFVKWQGGLGLRKANARLLSRIGKKNLKGYL
jgi:ASCH domain-containing protein